jgi:hypothetical protein
MVLHYEKKALAPLAVPLLLAAAGRHQIRLFL